MRAMAGCVVGFSDDGSGVQDPGVMKRAMLEAKAANRPIAAHCEDESLLLGVISTTDGTPAGMVTRGYPHKVNTPRSAGT